MKTFVPLILALIISLMGASTVFAAPLNLFEGDTLSHWYTWIKDRGRDQDPKKVFTMKDGVLRVSGEEFGCITSNEEYANYHLLVEYKWGTITFAPRVECARDSGVLINSVVEDGGFSGTWMNSIEVQLIEGGTGDFIVVGNGTDAYAITSPVAPEMQGSSHVFSPDGKPVTITGGRINWYGRDPAWADVKDFRGAKDVEKPIGEWNRLEVITDGGKITVLLNGIVVNSTIDCTPKKGCLQIQSEGAEIFFRKVVLTPRE